MNYTLEIDIDLPLEKTVELFDSTDNLLKWQPGLLSVEHLSGEAGKDGAKSVMRFKRGKKGTMDMVETITKMNLPDEIESTYEMNGVFNIQKNSFQSINDNTTNWISDCEFKFDKVTYKLMAFLMPGAFKKQSYKFMQYFKSFAEEEAAKV